MFIFIDIVGCHPSDIFSSFVFNNIVGLAGIFIFPWLSARMFWQRASGLFCLI